jgi:hypothetical protein
MSLSWWLPWLAMHPKHARIAVPCSLDNCRLILNITSHAAATAKRCATVAHAQLQCLNQLNLPFNGST